MVFSKYDSDPAWCAQPSTSRGWQKGRQGSPRLGWQGSGLPCLPSYCPQQVSSMQVNCSAPCGQRGVWRTTWTWTCTGEVPEVAHSQGGFFWESWWCSCPTPWLWRADLPHGAKVALAKPSIASFLATPRPSWSPQLFHLLSGAPVSSDPTPPSTSQLACPQISWEDEGRACLCRQRAQPGGRWEPSIQPDASWTRNHL